MTLLALGTMVGFISCLVGYNQIIRRLRVLEEKAEGGNSK